MAKIHPVSDVHFRNKQDAIDWANELPYGVDIVAIAGDIANGSKIGTSFMRDICEACPDLTFVVCLGNHDYWRDVSMVSAQHRWSALEKSLPNLRFLNGAPITVKGVRFIGDTLWTDMRLDGDFYVAQEIYHNKWPDYTEVGFCPTVVGFPAYEFVHQFNLTLSAIFKQVDQALKDDVPFYVMTHHLPDPLSLDERYAGSEFNPFYASADILDNLPVPSGIWHHGHTHAAKDYRKNGWRVICNPRGYLVERYGADETRARLGNNSFYTEIGE